MSLFSKKTPAVTPRQYGKLIVLDGTDGTGKATQSALLKANLEAQGYLVAVLEFPRYESEASSHLKKYLAGEYGELSPKQAAILFALDRFDAKEEIKGYLEAGYIVVADRYVTSNAGHQGAKIADESERVQFYRWLNDLEYNIFNLPKSDLNIILHLPAEIASKLIEKRGPNSEKIDVMHENDMVHLKNAEEVYLEVAKIFPNTKLIECLGPEGLLSEQQIQNQIIEVVRRMVLKNEFPPISQ